MLWNIVSKLGKVYEVYPVLKVSLENQPVWFYCQGCKRLAMMVHGYTERTFDIKIVEVEYIKGQSDIVGSYFFFM